MTSFDDPDGAMPEFDGEPSRELHGEPAAGSTASGPAQPDGDGAGDGGGASGLGGGYGPGGGPPGAPVPTECLHRSVIFYWLISGLIGWVFSVGFFGAGAAFVYAKWSAGWPYVLPAVIGLLSVQLIWILISPWLAYARWRYHIDGDLLLMRYGILFIEEKAIPISRMQHVDLYRGVLERMIGLTTLVVFTAGTEGAHFRLPGLSMDRAPQLRDMILAARGDDVI